tara:strand:- start:48259 stop:48480 length:222 start_codon:yes stop_codon:yes gene_type:complete
MEWGACGVDRALEAISKRQQLLVTVAEQEHMQAKLVTAVQLHQLMSKHALNAPIIESSPVYLPQIRKERKILI